MKRVLLGLLFACACAPPPVTVQPGPVGTAIVCPPGADADHDLLSDTCELALARAFAPELVVSRNDCNWDASVQDGRLGGEYYFGAQPADSGRIRIVYLPAYYRDCGWKGLKCHHPFIQCEGHSGDSEFIAIDVQHTNRDMWTAARVFLSAHCFDKLNGYCRWYEGRELDRFEWRGGRRVGPVVWVAEGKGAHYRSRSECDRGHLMYDTCDRNDVRWTYTIASEQQNIGSRTQPVGDAGGCVDGAHAGWNSRLAERVVLECFWDPNRRFTGWQRPAFGDASPYERYLREIAGF